MNNMDQDDRKYEQRVLAAGIIYVSKFGLSVIPIGKNKVPAVEWKKYQNEYVTVGQLIDWPKVGLGIVTGAISNLVVIDCESEEDARWFWVNRGKSPSVVKSKRGYHFYFKHPGERVMNDTKVENRYDVRGDGGYVMAPPSRHSNGNYSWSRPMIATDQLPVFDMAWRPVRQASPDSPEMAPRFHSAIAYISKIYAVSGQNGHDSAYQAARCLREGGLSQAEAMLAMQKWNETNANPQWSDRDLVHKIHSAFSS